MNHHFEIPFNLGLRYPLMQHSRGQGALEYLLLVGAAVAIVIAVILVSNAVANQSGNQTKGQVNTINNLIVNAQQTPTPLPPGFSIFTPAPTP